MKHLLSISLLSVVTLMTTPSAALSEEARIDVHASEFMVTAAHPAAVEAGLQAMRDGGNAIDAAVATAFTLGVVEPNGSGIGGGGFLLYYQADAKRFYFLDFRETAPAKLPENHYTNPDGTFTGERMDVGGPSVGTPGMVKGLAHAHGKFGKRPFGELLNGAIKAAEEGFPVTPNFTVILNEYNKLLNSSPQLKATFLKEDGTPPPLGTMIRQPKMANTLRAIAEHGPSYIYEGEGAKMIVDAVAAHGGVLSLEDLRDYRARERKPVRGNYRGYEVVSAPPPSSGGWQVIQMLALLEPFDIAAMGPQSPEYLARLAAVMGETGIIANRELGDPLALRTDYNALSGEEWEAQMRERIRILQPPVKTKDSGNTTHFSIIDKEGNVVSLTQTIQEFFGSGIVVPELGVILNNELSDFSFIKGAVNAPAPNRIPRSNMSPTILVKEGEPVAAFGSPAGARIPGAVVQTIVQVIDFNRTMGEALAAPRIFHDGPRGIIHYESRIPAETMQEAVKLLGEEGRYTIRERAPMVRFFGGVHAIRVLKGEQFERYLEGAADPRRDGKAAGE